MKTGSLVSHKASRRSRRFWLWGLVLAVLVVLVAIWTQSLPQAGKRGKHSSTTAGRVSSSQKGAPLSTAAGNPSSPAQGVARLAWAFLFDSNRISGGVLFSKGRDSKSIPDSDAPSGHDLWVRDASGAERLANASVFSARFSPDGQRLAFTTSGCTLRVEDLRGNKLAEVEGGYAPQWKPDGSAVVFAKVPEGRNVYLPGTLHLATLDLASGKVALLTDGRFDDGRPEFHPSGNWVLFVSGGRSGFASFWRLDPGNGEPAQVTNIGQRARDETFVPTPYRKTIWSPDGGWFLYDFKSGEREQIWGLQFTANGDLVRASKLADGLDPAWTEEGKAFVYSKRVNDHVESAVATLP